MIIDGDDPDNLFRLEDGYEMDLKNGYWTDPVGRFVYQLGLEAQDEAMIERWVSPESDSTSDWWKSGIRMAGGWVKLL
ncbi:hypothetical protein PPACK8108_LOCUS5432, partial [Phakopsora pachyrhizi]